MINNSHIFINFPFFILVISILSSCNKKSGYLPAGLLFIQAMPNLELIFTTTYGKNYWRAKNRRSSTLIKLRNIINWANFVYAIT
jgi:hypothetical protein